MSIACVPESPASPDLACLLMRIGHHDAEAFRALHTLTAPRLLGVALKLLRHHDAAEDAVQEAFMRIWYGAASYQPALSPPMAWMMLIVRSRALDAMRRARAGRAHLTDAFDPALDDLCASDDGDPAQLACASQQLALLQHYLSLLEAGQRRLICLAFLQEMSHGEVASEMQLPLGTVKTSIRRGLLRLRGQIGRAGRAPRPWRGEAVAGLVVPALPL